MTHGVDMNQRHVELSVLGRVPGKGLNVRMPASPNVAPPGWYMLFVLDAAGTPSVARWVQLRAGAPDAPTLAADGPSPPWRLELRPRLPPRGRHEGTARVGKGASPRPQGSSRTADRPR